MLSRKRMNDKCADQIARMPYAGILWLPIVHVDPDETAPEASVIRVHLNIMQPTL